MAMHVSSLLIAAFLVALPLTLLTLAVMMAGYDWRTYRVAIDVGRSEGERSARRTVKDVEDIEDADEPSRPVVRGPGGLRGWFRRRLYTYYRRG
jgi:hypothetical protein